MRNKNESSFPYTRNPTRKSSEPPKTEYLKLNSAERRGYLPTQYRRKRMMENFQDDCENRHFKSSRIKIANQHNTRQKLTFTIDHPACKNVQIQIEKLRPESLEYLDVNAWIKEFANLQELNKWEHKVTIQMLKLVTDASIHPVFEKKQSLETVYFGLKSYFYKKEIFPQLERELRSIRTTQFETTRDYYQKILAVALQCDLCLEKENYFNLRELEDIFMKGLTNRERQLVINKGLQSPDEIATFLDKVRDMEKRYLYLETPNTSRGYVPKREIQESTQRPRSFNNRHKTSNKWCTLHRTNTHDNYQCLAQQNRKEKESYENKSLTIKPNDFKIEEKHGNIELLGKFENQKVSIGIDTGSTFTFINPQLTRPPAIKKINEPIELKTANGTTAHVNEETKIDFSIDSLPKQTFKARAFLLNNLPVDINLGCDFLREHRALVDFDNGKLKLGTGEIELPQSGRQEGETDQLKSIIEQFHQLPEKIQPISNESLTLTLKENAKLPTAVPYRCPLSMRQAYKESIDTLLKEGIIQESTSPCASAAFPIEKKNKSLRIVIDFRKLNSQLRSECFPFPNIQDILTELRTATIFSKLDMYQGYHQLEVEPKSRWITSFVTPFGQYEYRRMPFDLVVAPRRFQRLMTKLFENEPNVHVFLDDILIASQTREQHKEDLIRVLEIIKEKKMTLNKKKCEFGRSSVSFVGQIIEAGTIRADLSEANLSKITTPPKTVKQLRSVLGYVNWFRPYIIGLSEKLVFLTEKLKKKAFNWSEKDTEKLFALTELIDRSQTLNIPNPTEPYVLTTDASDIGVSGILTQQDKLIRLYSKKLNATEQKYTVVEKEIYAIVLALKEFRNLIHGSEIEVKTDNRNICFDSNPLSSRAQRWKTSIQEFNCQFTHTSGKTNTAPDFLSRSLIICPSSLSPITKKIMDIQQAFNEKTEPKLSKITIEGKSILITRDKKVWIPKERQEDFLQFMHVFLGHPGSTRMYRSLRRFYLLKNGQRACENLVFDCNCCQRNKNTRHKQGILKGFMEAERPKQKVTSDLFGPIDLSHYQSQGKAKAKPGFCSLTTCFQDIQK